MTNIIVGKPFSCIYSNLYKIFLRNLHYSSGDSPSTLKFFRVAALSSEKARTIAEEHREVCAVAGVFWDIEVVEQDNRILCSKEIFND